MKKNRSPPHFSSSKFMALLLMITLSGCGEKEQTKNTTEYNVINRTLPVTPIDVLVGETHLRIPSDYGMSVGKWNSEKAAYVDYVHIDFDGDTLLPKSKASRKEISVGIKDRGVKQRGGVEDLQEMLSDAPESRYPAIPNSTLRGEALTKKYQRPLVSLLKVC